MDRNDIEMLEKLNQLKEKSVLTEDEFNDEKNKILDKSKKSESEEETKSIEKEENIKTTVSENEIHNRIKMQTIEEQLKTIGVIVYITAFTMIGLISMILLSAIIYGKYANFEFIGNLLTIGGYTLIGWFAASFIYLTMVIKNKMMPKMGINILIWAICILEISGSTQMSTAGNVMNIAIPVGLVCLDICAILYGNKGYRLIYKCPKCGTKIKKDQAKCNICDTEIDWN